MLRPQDILTMARTVFGEAEPHDRDDAIAIAHVICNRATLPNWPSKIEAVCLQPFQFSCWNADNPRREMLLTLNLDTKTEWWQEVVEVCWGVAGGEFPDPTSRSTHYYATYIKAPKWARGHVPVYHSAWGKYTHAFFNDIDTPPPTTAASALDQERPLGETRTVTGVKTGVGGITGVAVAEALQELATQVEPLVPYLDTLKWVFLALALTGVCIVAWARINDRAEGKR